MSKLLKKDLLREDNSYHISQIKTSTDSLIATHAALATVHQDAPALIAASINSSMSATFAEGYAGFVRTQGWFSVAFSDPNAYVNGNYRCPHTRADWYFVVVSRSNTAIRTALGKVFIDSSEHGEDLDYNIANNQNMNLLHGLAQKLYFTIYGPLSLTKGDIVSIQWGKANAAGTGTLYIHGMFFYY